jgi:hypothetical protein
MDTTFATICSLLPYELHESKPGLHPNYFTITSEEPFSLTIIPNNIYYRVNPDPLADQKSTRYINVPVPAIECARSIVNDYVAALLAIEPPDKVPGLFAVSGDWTDKKLFVASHSKQIDKYKNAQIEWFKNLVNIADDIWSKTHSPVSIGDLQRFAAKQLGYERDWLDATPIELAVKCPYCKSPINAGAIKCITCHEILDKKKYEELAMVK